MDIVDPRQWGDRYYVCHRCNREVLFSRTDYMSAVRKADNTFTLMFHCVCDPNRAQDDIFQVDPDALRRFLRGMLPILPYRAAPGKALPLTDEHERLLRIFSWECENLESVSDFLLFARHPG